MQQRDAQPLDHTAIHMVPSRSLCGVCRVHDLPDSRRARTLHSTETARRGHVVQSSNWYTVCAPCATSSQHAACSGWRVQKVVIASTRVHIESTDCADLPHTH